MSRLRQFDAQGDLVGDADAVAFEGDDFFRVIGEDANVAEAEVDQDLRADAAFVLDHALAGGFAIELAAFVKMNLRKRAGLFGGFDAEAASGVMQVEKNAAVFLGDGGERARNEFAAIASGRTENISGEAVRMDAHQRRLGAFQVAAHEGNVLIMVHVAGVGDHAEIAEARGQNCFGNAPDVAFVLHAVADQVRDREHLQVVFLAKFDELRHAGHGAVITHDFADDAGGSEAGDAREVHGRFRLAGANEHAAIARAQRKNVAGAREILRLRLGIDGGENRDGAIGSADAGGDADARVHGFGEGRAVDGSVDRRHEREAKLVAALFGERHADQAAAVLGHEVDGVGSDFFGGHGEVAFVFAVLVVHQDDHAALANFFDGFFDGGEMGGVFSHKLFVLSFPQMIAPVTVGKAGLVA